MTRLARPDAPLKALDADTGASGPVPVVYTGNSLYGWAWYTSDCAELVP